MTVAACSEETPPAVPFSIEIRATPGASVALRVRYDETNTRYTCVSRGALRSPLVLPAGACIAADIVPAMTHSSRFGGAQACVSGAQSHSTSFLTAISASQHKLHEYTCHGPVICAKGLPALWKDEA